MEKLIEIIADYVEIDGEITADMEFKKDLGIGSFETTCIIDDINSALGIELEPNDFIEYKTVGEMAAHINA